MCVCTQQLCIQFGAINFMCVSVHRLLQWRWRRRKKKTFIEYAFGQVECVCVNVQCIIMSEVIPIKRYAIPIDEKTTTTSMCVKLELVSEAFRLKNTQLLYTVNCREANEWNVSVSVLHFIFFILFSFLLKFGMLQQWIR